MNHVVQVGRVNDARVRVDLEEVVVYLVDGRALRVAPAVHLSDCSVGSLASQHVLQIQIVDEFRGERLDKIDALRLARHAAPLGRQMLDATERLAHKAKDSQVNE